MNCMRISANNDEFTAWLSRICWNFCCFFLRSSLSYFQTENIHVYIEIDVSNELNHRISDCINKRNRLKVYAYLCGAILWNNCGNRSISLGFNLKRKIWFKKEHIKLLIFMPRNGKFIKSFLSNLIIISSKQIFQLN